MRDSIPDGTEPESYDSIHDTYDVNADFIHNRCDNGTRNNTIAPRRDRREPFAPKRTPTGTVAEANHD